LNRSGGEGEAVVGAEGGSRHSAGLPSLCVQETSACVAILRNESMSRAGTGMKVARALLLLGVGSLAFLGGATCALLVSKRPPSGYAVRKNLAEILQSERTVQTPYRHLTMLEQRKLP